MVNFYNLNVNTYMFITELTARTQHTRKSKCGLLHVYYRDSKIVKLRCDCCTEIFYRPRGKMDPKRISNEFFHCCDDCDSKRFAQRKGVEWKKVWDLDASSDLDISKI